MGTTTTTTTIYEVVEVEGKPLWKEFHFIWVTLAWISVVAPTGKMLSISKQNPDMEQQSKPASTSNDSTQQKHIDIDIDINTLSLQPIYSHMTWRLTGNGEAKPIGRLFRRQMTFQNVLTRLWRVGRFSVCRQLVRLRNGIAEEQLHLKCSETFPWIYWRIGYCSLCSFKSDFFNPSSFFFSISRSGIYLYISKYVRSFVCVCVLVRLIHDTMTVINLACIRVP